MVNIHKVFIKGNNEAATAARNREIPKDTDMRIACFGLVANEALADATLEISQDTAPNGRVTASGTLTDHAGNLVWSESKQSFGISHLTGESEARDASQSLMYVFEDEMCGIPPLIELSKVRKIYVGPSDRATFKAVNWASSCLTFVERPVQADAVFMPHGIRGLKGRQVCALFDGKNNDFIPGWETVSLKDIGSLERAVGCH
jgi:hypothetical protein